MTGKNVIEPNERQRPSRSHGRDKPDARPARLMVGAGALAAMTVIGAGLVDFPLAVAEESVAPATTDLTMSQKKTEKVKRPVTYVRLKPGQKAPKGARVMQEAEPTPRVIVKRVVTLPSTRPARPVARSRQSGG